MTRTVKEALTQAKELTTHTDYEASHVELDKLMEELLIELGYEELVAFIRTQVRWYA